MYMMVQRKHQTKIGIIWFFFLLEVGSDIKLTYTSCKKELVSGQSIIINNPRLSYI